MKQYIKLYTLFLLILLTTFVNAQTGCDLLKKLGDDLAEVGSTLRPFFEDAANVGGKRIKAWEKLIDFPLLRKNVDALEYVANPRTNKILVNVEEALGGHSVARHGHQIPLVEMEQRVLNTHPSMPQSRSALKFDNEAIHNDAVDKAFNYYKAEIKAHFDAGGGYRTWDAYEYGDRVGEGYHNYATLSNPTATYVTTTKVKIAFRPDPTHPDGFMLDSAYPFFQP